MIGNILLLSDLHLEFGERPPKSYYNQDASVVILAGDIHVGPVNVINVLQEFSEHYAKVLYLPGNHEYYGHDRYTFDQQIAKHGINNVHVLNPGAHQIEDVVFIGAPLWTNFREDVFAERSAERFISDFSRIKEFSPLQAKELYYTHLAFIKKAYESIPGKKVIITHFLPATDCISKKYRGENLLNKYFANDLGGWIGNMSNVTWCYAHTHDPDDFMLGDTRMICNPRGYPREANNNLKVFNV